jgi:cytochrome b561
MFQNIAYLPIHGIPLIAYGGLLALILILSTATVGYLIHHNLAKIPFTVHKTLAFTAIAVALLHGILGILAYFF